jgi:hypothetical protein
MSVINRLLAMRRSPYTELNHALDLGAVIAAIGQKQSLTGD